MVMVLHVSEHLPSSDSDEDELGGTDTESEEAPCAFEAQSDSDEVMITNMNDDQRLVRHHMREGCVCSFKCYSQFTDDEGFHIRLQMQELERSQRDFVLLGKLQVLGKGADTSVSHSRKTSSKLQRVTYQYAYDHCIVYKSAFCFLHCIGEKDLKNFHKHLKDHSIIPHEHGNKGRLPPNAFTFDRLLWNLSQTTPQCLVYHSQQQEEDVHLLHLYFSQQVRDTTLYIISMLRLVWHPESRQPNTTPSVRFGYSVCHIFNS